MRVLIDTTYAGRATSGTGVYLEQLIPALRAQGVEVIAVRNRRRAAPGGGARRSIANYLSDRLWTAIALPAIAAARRVDVIHHPLPARAPLAPCPQVITVHDLAFVRRPDLFAIRYAIWASRAHRAAARAAAAVVCPSEATREDVVEHWGVARERTLVAGHGPGQVASWLPRADAEHFLYVGDDEPRKRVSLLIEAHRRYRAAGGSAPLVIAGAAAKGAAAAGSVPGVERVQAPSREQLERLHAGAIALVHAAVEDGFGLTLLEAMALGTPVIAVRSRAAVELCGDAARLVAPDDAAGLARAMAAMERNDALRGRLAAAGEARSHGFSWDQSARTHIAAYTLAAR